MFSRKHIWFGTQKGVVSLDNKLPNMLINQSMATRPATESLNEATSARCQGSLRSSPCAAQQGDDETDEGLPRTFDDDSQPPSGEPSQSNMKAEVAPLQHGEGPAQGPGPTSDAKSTDQARLCTTHTWTDGQGTRNVRSEKATMKDVSAAVAPLGDPAAGVRSTAEIAAQESLEELLYVSSLLKVDFLQNICRETLQLCGKDSGIGSGMGRAGVAVTTEPENAGHNETLSSVGVAQKKKESPSFIKSLSTTSFLSIPSSLSLSGSTPAPQETAAALKDSIVSEIDTEPSKSSGSPASELCSGTAVLDNKIGESTLHRMNNEPSVSVAPQKQKVCSENAECSLTTRHSPNDVPEAKSKELDSAPLRPPAPPLQMSSGDSDTGADRRQTDADDRLSESNTSLPSPSVVGGTHSAPEVPRPGPSAETSRQPVSSDQSSDPPASSGPEKWRRTTVGLLHRKSASTVPHDRSSPFRARSAVSLLGWRDHSVESTASSEGKQEASPPWAQPIIDLCVIMKNESAKDGFRKVPRAANLKNGESTKYGGGQNVSICIRTASEPQQAPTLSPEEGFSEAAKLSTATEAQAQICPIHRGEQSEPGAQKRSSLDPVKEDAQEDDDKEITLKPSSTEAVGPSTPTFAESESTERQLDLPEASAAPKPHNDGAVGHTAERTQPTTLPEKASEDLAREGAEPSASVAKRGAEAGPATPSSLTCKCATTSSPITSGATPSALQEHKNQDTRQSSFAEACSGRSEAEMCPSERADRSDAKSRRKKEVPLAISEIVIFFPDRGESAPPGFSVCQRKGLPIDLNTGTLGERTFLCFKKSRRNPLVDVALVMGSRKEDIPYGYTLIENTPLGHRATLNSGNAGNDIMLCIKRKLCTVEAVTGPCELYLPLFSGSTVEHDLNLQRELRENVEGHSWSKLRLALTGGEERPKAPHSGKTADGASPSTRPAAAEEPKEDSGKSNRGPKTVGRSVSPSQRPPDAVGAGPSSSGKPPPLQNSDDSAGQDRVCEQNAKQAEKRHPSETEASRRSSESQVQVEGSFQRSEDHEDKRELSEGLRGSKGSAAKPCSGATSTLGNKRRGVTARSFLLLRSLSMRETESLSDVGHEASDSVSSEVNAGKSSAAKNEKAVFARASSAPDTYLEIEAEPSNKNIDEDLGASASLTNSVEADNESFLSAVITSPTLSEQGESDKDKDVESFATAVFSELLPEDNSPPSSTDRISPSTTASHDEISRAGAESLTGRNVVPPDESQGDEPSTAVRLLREEGVRNHLRDGPSAQIGGPSQQSHSSSIVTLPTDPNFTAHAASSLARSPLKEFSNSESNSQRPDRRAPYVESERAIRGQNLCLQDGCHRRWVLAPFLVGCYSGSIIVKTLSINALKELLDAGFFDEDSKEERKRSFTLLDYAFEAVCDSVQGASTSIHVSVCGFLLSAVKQVKSSLHCQSLYTIFSAMLYIHQCEQQSSRGPSAGGKLLSAASSLDEDLEDASAVGASSRPLLQQWASELMERDPTIAKRIELVSLLSECEGKPVQLPSCARAVASQAQVRAADAQRASSEREVKEGQTNNSSSSSNNNNNNNNNSSNIKEKPGSGSSKISNAQSQGVNHNIVESAGADIFTDQRRRADNDSHEEGCQSEEARAEGRQVEEDFVGERDLDPTSNSPTSPNLSDVSTSSACKDESQRERGVPTAVQCEEDPSAETCADLARCPCPPQASSPSHLSREGSQASISTAPKEEEFNGSSTSQRFGGHTDSAGGLSGAATPPDDSKEVSVVIADRDPPVHRALSKRGRVISALSLGARAADKPHADRGSTAADKAQGLEDKLHSGSSDIVCRRQEKDSLELTPRRVRLFSSIVYEAEVPRGSTRGLAKLVKTICASLMAGDSSKPTAPATDAGGEFGEAKPAVTASKPTAKDGKVGDPTKLKLAPDLAPPSSSRSTMEDLKDREHGAQAGKSCEAALKADLGHFSSEDEEESDIQTGIRSMILHIVGGVVDRVELVKNTEAAVAAYKSSPSFESPQFEDQMETAANNIFVDQKRRNVFQLLVYLCKLASCSPVSHSQEELSADPLGVRSLALELLRELLVDVADYFQLDNVFGNQVRRFAASTIMSLCAVQNIHLFRLVLSHISVLWKHYRRFLKIELSLLIENGILRTLRSPHVLAEYQMAVLVELVPWFQLPHNLVELFLNFDMDRQFIQSWTIVEQTCAILSAIGEGGAVAASADEIQGRQLQVQALENVVAIVRGMMDASGHAHLIPRDARTRQLSMTKHGGWEAADVDDNSSETSTTTANSHGDHAGLSDVVEDDLAEDTFSDSKMRLVEGSHPRPSNAEDATDAETRGASQERARISPRDTKWSGERDEGCGRNASEVLSAESAGDISADVYGEVSAETSLGPQREAECTAEEARPGLCSLPTSSSWTEEEDSGCESSCYDSESDYTSEVEHAVEADAAHNKHLAGSEPAQVCAQENDLAAECNTEHSKSLLEAQTHPQDTQERGNTRLSEKVSTFSVVGVEGEHKSCIGGDSTLAKDTEGVMTDGVTDTEDNNVGHESDFQHLQESLDAPKTGGIGPPSLRGTSFGGETDVVTDNPTDLFDGSEDNDEERQNTKAEGEKSRMKVRRKRKKLKQRSSKIVQLESSGASGLESSSVARKGSTFSTEQKSTKPSRRVSFSDYLSTSFDEESARQAEAAHSTGSVSALSPHRLPVAGSGSGTGVSGSSSSDGELRSSHHPSGSLSDSASSHGLGGSESRVMRRRPVRRRSSQLRSAPTPGHRRHSSVRLRQELQQQSQETLRQAMELCQSKGLKKCIEYLVATNFLSESPRDIASFLRMYHDEIGENEIGDYLGEGDAEFKVHVRLTFVRAISFTGMTLESSLRHFLTNGGFRLPGEAQKIERMVEAFAQCYWEDNPHSLSSPDTAMILAYSIILLNTDLHKPQVKKRKKMTREAFVKNNKGIDGGRDLPQSLLEEIYNNVQARPIKIDVGMDRSSKRDTGGANVSDAERYWQEMRKAVSQSEELMKGLSHAFRTFYFVGVNTNLSPDLVKLMFERVWFHFLALVNSMLSKPDAPLDMVASCLDMIGYSISACLFLGMKTERQAFATQLAKFRYMENNVKEGVAEDPDGYMYVVKGKHKEEEWFKNIEAATSVDDAWRIIGDVHELVMQLKETIQERQTYETLQAVIKRINKGSKLLQNTRRFIREGDLTKKCRTKNRVYRFFLFNDQLTYCDRGMSGKYNVHASLRLRVTRIENIRGTSRLFLRNAFKILNPTKSFIVIADSAESKAEWMREIDTAIASATHSVQKKVRRLSLIPSTESSATGEAGQANLSHKFVLKRDGSGVSEDLGDSCEAHDLEDLSSGKDRENLGLPVRGAADILVVKEETLLSGTIQTAKKVLKPGTKPSRHDNASKDSAAKVEEKKRDGEAEYGKFESVIDLSRISARLWRARKNDIDTKQSNQEKSGSTAAKGSNEDEPSTATNSVPVPASREGVAARAVMKVNAFLKERSADPVSKVCAKTQDDGTSDAMRLEQADKLGRTEENPIKAER